MAVERIRIAYNGSAVDDGSMDVNDFAPALLAFGKFIQRINVLSGNDKPIAVKLKADDIRHGSFDVSLILEPTIVENIQLFLGAGIIGIPAIMQVLGYVSTLKNIYDLIKELHGKKLTKVEVKGNGNVEIQVSGDNNQVIVVPEITYKTFCDYEARECLERVVRPVRCDGITGFSMRNPNDPEDKAAVATVSKQDVDVFDVPPESYDETDDTVSTAIMVFKIVGIVFDENQKWRFSDGESTFWAKIEDEKFWKSVEDGTLSFRKGDRLKVEYTAHQHLERNGGITVTKTINKVLEHLKRSTQIKLDFDK